MQRVIPRFHIVLLQVEEGRLSDIVARTKFVCIFDGGSDGILAKLGKVYDLIYEILHERELLVELAPFLLGPLTRKAWLVFALSQLYYRISRFNIAKFA